jgi:hypothetical protein
MGSGTISGPPYLLVSLVVGLVLIGVVGMMYGARVQAWVEKLVLQRLPSRNSGSGNPTSPAEVVDD